MAALKQLVSSLVVLVASTVAVVDLKSWQVTKTLSPRTGPDGMAWVR